MSFPARTIPDRETLLRENPDLPERIRRLTKPGERPYTDCRVWKRCRRYAVIWIFVNGTKRPYLAHRVAYILTVGSLDPTKEINHLCGNPKCVNAEHLHPCTREFNLKDAAAARRIKRHVTERGGTISAVIARVIRPGDPQPPMPADDDDEELDRCAPWGRPRATSCESATNLRRATGSRRVTR